MTWTRKFSSDIYDDPNDPRRQLPNDEVYERTGEDKPQLGDRIFQHYGVWQYPFARVKKDPEEGWYLDWFDFPGSIHDMTKVNLGDKVADAALNMTPYWEVTGIDEDKGRIYVQPIEPNPFLTGVGAGGAQITEHDFEVHSGEYEKNRIDDILKTIKNRSYFTPSDIAYLFLGTVPVHMGPNGSQGGWYQPTDTWNNRGGQQGMDPKEIMIRDATKYQEMGFAVPPKAIDGSLDPSLWGSFVDGSSDLKPDLLLPGENWNDLATVKNFVLNHPQPNIKFRNWHALLKLNVPDQEMREILAQIAPLKHPNEENFEKVTNGYYDAYFNIKEQAVGVAARHHWLDVMRNYEKVKDKDVRSDLAWRYGQLNDLNSVIRMTQTETDPKVLSSILRAFSENKRSATFLIDQDLPRWVSATTLTGDPWKDYYIEQLQHARILLKDNEETGSFSPLFGGVSLADYLQTKTASGAWNYKYG